MEQKRLRTTGLVQSSLSKYGWLIGPQDAILSANIIFVGLKYNEDAATYQ